MQTVETIQVSVSGSTMDSRDRQEKDGCQELRGRGNNVSTVSDGEDENSGDGGNGCTTV